MARTIVEASNPRWISTKGSNLGFEIIDVSDNSAGRTVKVQRKKVDRTRDEVVIEERERFVPDDVWRFFILGYEPA